MPKEGFANKEPTDALREGASRGWHDDAPRPGARSLSLPQGTTLARAAGAPRVAYVSLGCRTNRADTDAIATALASLGCVLASEREADAVIVNTCAVTGEAEAKARKACRRAAALPGVKVVVATGCVAALASSALAAACPGVAVVADKRQVARRTVELLAKAGIDVGEGLARGVVAGSPPGTPTGRTRPSVKVQDGCDLRCTYCVVWKARGPARSVASDEVVASVAREFAAGAGEVVLTGINVGSYRDAAVGNLAGLLRAILRATSVGRVRLASIEPADVTGELLAVMAESRGRVAPFLHVCLQSGADPTLARMGRSYDTATFAQVVANARAAVPGIALGTDVIVGFPGETGADFAKSLDFCRACAFARMHVFRYSPRPGTPAAVMDDRPTAEASASRAAAMRELARGMREDYAASRVGKDELVLVQEPGRGVTGGLLDATVDASLPVGSLVGVSVRAVKDARLVCC